MNKTKALLNTSVSYPDLEDAGFNYNSENDNFDFHSEIAETAWAIGTHSLPLSDFSISTLDIGADPTIIELLYAAYAAGRDDGRRQAKRDIRNFLME